MLFVIEETRKQFRYTFRSYVAVIVASAGSAFGMELVGGAAPQLRIDTDALPLVLLPTFMLLGAVLGVLGLAFNKTLVMALDWRAKAFARVPFLYPILVGAAVGVLAFVLPMAVGGGETLIPDLPLANLPLHTLLLIAVVRFVGTMASYPVGVPAGIFSPMLTFGHHGRPDLRPADRDGAGPFAARGAAADRGGLRRGGDGRAVLVDHPRAPGRRRAGGRADRRLRADPAADGDLRDGACRRPGAGRPADLRGAARALRAAGRPGTAHAPSTATSSPVGIDEPPRPDTR